jgi:peptidoglycan hydrolase-like protein with peptidoglycan-binding domain
MKNKRTYYIVGFLIFAVIIYLLFFRKKRPENLKVGDTSIVPGPNNVPTVFKCLRTIQTSKNEQGIEVVKPYQFPLRYGDCGKAVETMQKRLIAKGVKISADGKFGRLTEKALNEIYKSKGQPETGQYTWNQFVTEALA